MKNNLLVSQGLWLLLPAFADGVAQQYRMFYKKDWWDEIRNTLSEQTDLPYGGKYDELISSLDISSCIKLVDRNWNTVFYKALDADFRCYVKELQCIRNKTAHVGSKDISIQDTVRALDTMKRIAAYFDFNARDNINTLYENAVKDELQNNSPSTDTTSHPDWQSVVKIAKVKEYAIAFAQILAKYVMVVDVYSYDFLNYYIYFVTNKSSVDTARAEEWFDTCRDYFPGEQLHFIQIRKPNGQFYTADQVSKILQQSHKKQQQP